MSLLVDRTSPTVQDLLRIDGSLLDVASIEGIDLDSKLGIAREEVAYKVLAILVESGESADTLESVVVTEPMHRWIALKTVSLCFRDGHFRHLSDRYKEKWTLYERLSHEAYDDLMRLGLGRTANPMPRPSVGAISKGSGSLEDGSYLIAFSALNAWDEESEVSECASIYLSMAEGIHAEMPILPPQAVAWNVYVGRTQESLQKQNSTPLAIGTSIEVQVLENYGSPSTGQAPALYTKALKRILRG